METSISYCDAVAFFSSDERRWINKMHKLKAQHPNEVTIIKEPEDNDGCIYCRLPSKWMKITPPRVYSDEQVARMTARLRGE